MARALLKSTETKTVIGYDHSEALAAAFHQEATECGKALLKDPPKSLKEAISKDQTDFVVVVLQNEKQCQDVCFGDGTGSDRPSLIDLAPKGSCVIVCSTVTATWIKQAASKFQEKGIRFVDCPISGGPVRALAGELTLMASSDNDETLAVARPVLDIMGRDIFIIKGGAGMGSTVKMAHQLLAGVHVCVAGEALALAAKAGLDVDQFYKLVIGAAGTSFMFEDRGKRMLQDPKDVEIKSQLGIFVKDLNIVHSEALSLKSPIPIASAALQQFISGQSLGLTRQDDSQVVKVYETITGVAVSSSAKATREGTDGNGVGDLWKMEDGTVEEIMEVGSEPRHKVVLQNEYTRVLRVEFPAGDTTCAHRHAEDSLYFFLVEGGLDIVNHVKGSEPACDCVAFGEIRYGTHKTDKPLIHKITNSSDKAILCIDAEVIKKPPVTAVIPLVADKHELIKTRDKCRVYKLSLKPGESVQVSYPFFYLSVVLKGGTTVETEVAGPIRWTETANVGDVHWKNPATLKKTNTGSSEYIEFVSEWC